MQLAPIVLFVYNRPDHTAQTLNALMQNDLADQSTLFIYSDGPKYLAAEKQIEKISAVRNLIRSKQWCKEIHIVEAVRNKGLADSILSGVTEVINEHGKVIVLEDDIITTKGFLRYMNDALRMYHNDEQVMHISGYMYPANIKSESSTFFLNILSCWGWGTWKRAWDHYNHDVDDHFSYFSQDKTRRQKFDIEGHAYFYEQLMNNYNGSLYSWAVRWYASWLRCGGYSLFPEKSLVKNIGHDRSGENCDSDPMYNVDVVDSIEVTKEQIRENQTIREKVDTFYQKALFKKKISIIRDYKYMLLDFAPRMIGKIFSFCSDKIYQKFPILNFFHVNWGTLRSGIIHSDMGNTINLTKPFHITDTVIGDYTYIQMHSRILNTTIGKFCSIGPYFLCGWGIHPIDGISTSPMFYSTKRQNGITLSKTDKVQEQQPIEIGNDVFIGSNVTVLDGVRIGDGAVIGAGSVVSKDIPPYAIAAGNPIKVTRYRFDDKTIEKLLSIKWWDWPIARLKKVEQFFFDIEKFIEDESSKPD